MAWLVPRLDQLPIGDLGAELYPIQPATNGPR